VASRSLRRIARGFYDTPQDNRLTGKPTYPNPRDVIDALARKGKVRVVVDGLTAANDLGLTDAVPARIGVLTDGRLRPITLGNLTLDFQAAAPSRLYWAGRPAMRFIGCEICFRPTTEVSPSASSPSSETPIMDRPFRTICAAACRRCRSGCG
jgi:hypothetical protein